MKIIPWKWLEAEICCLLFFPNQMELCERAHGTAHTQQTDHPLWLALGILLLGAAQVRTGVFLSCRALQSSLPEVRSKAGHGVQNLMAGQSGFQTWAGSSTSVPCCPTQPGLGCSIREISHGGFGDLCEPHRLCFEEKACSSLCLLEDKSRYPEAVAFGRREGAEPMLRSLKASHYSLYCLNNCESARVFIWVIISRCKC